MRGNGPEFDLLFWKGDGLDARRQQIEGAAQAVDRLADEQLLSQSDEELTAGLQRAFGVTVPTLNRAEVSYDRQIKTVDGTDHWGERARREVVVFYFEVPFEGEAIIFKIRPSQYDSSPPRGEVKGQVVRFSVVGEEDPQTLQRTANTEMDDIDRYLGWHREMWAGLEDDIAREVRPRLAQKRERMARLGDTEAGLAELGFKPKGR